MALVSESKVKKYIIELLNGREHEFYSSADLRDVVETLSPDGVNEVNLRSASLCGTKSDAEEDTLSLAIFFRPQDIANTRLIGEV